MRGMGEAVSRDLVQSLRLVWITLSLIILAILVSPFLLGRERLTGLVAVCERKARYGKECPFCGMTTSFLNISEGRFSEASRTNQAGIPLYVGFVSNEICALVLMRRKKGNTCK
jgi:hypothetical protein